MTRFLLAAVKPWMFSQVQFPWLLPVKDQSRLDRGTSQHPHRVFKGNTSAPEQKNTYQAAQMLKCCLVGERRVSPLSPHWV